MDHRFEQTLIPDTYTVKQALLQMDSLKGVPRTLFVIDSSQTIVGSLTDGDIRRGLLAGTLLTSPLSQVMHRDFMFISPEGSDTDAKLKKAADLDIRVLPILDGDRHLLDIIDLQHTTALLPIDAVLMAGGRGERLRPLTDTVPKPLLPVGGKPIIDHNIEALRRCGVSNIVVTVNYLHTLIEDHFRLSPTLHNVQCVLEPKPLGTFGSIGLVDTLSKPNVLVMNSDLLTSINFADMYRHHIQSEADLTMAVTTYTVSVPYAIVQTIGDSVQSFQEKPTYNFFANAGIYIVKRSLLNAVSGQTRIDATDFIDSLLADRRKVSYFPIDGTWIDIGSPDDYAMACSKFNNK